VGKETADFVQAKTLEIFALASEYAATKGLILADTKFEFGETEDGIIWIDEALTPDSSRFWQADLYEPGHPQASYDKQFVRDYLETLEWDKRPPGPVLPPEIVSRTREKYVEAYERLVGQPFKA
jgi:phosphoribosylaminoimidazole-succinocarboxamide synthase